LTFNCRTLSDLPEIAGKILDSLLGSRVFAFFGKMGSGKTTLIKAICERLGVADVVQSPSFAIINEYKTHSGDSVYHIDFYRIRKKEEIFDIGYEEYLFSGSYCFIEWPEMMEDLLPDGVIRIGIEVDSETGERVITF
jgi:tRNA threonylcarbamoyladenosine biosynthesis protein TsaE